MFHVKHVEGVFCIVNKNVYRNQWSRGSYVNIKVNLCLIIN